MKTILSDLYCRLCGDLKPVSVLTNMLINTEKCQEVSSKLTRLDLYVNFNTKLPKTVCSECINSLERAYDFVKSVELAQEAFEDYDSTVFDDKVNEDSTNDSRDKSTNNNFCIDTENSIFDDSEVNNDLLVEYIPKNKAEEDNLKSKSEKPKSRRKPPVNRSRVKPKISANVDLDTWQDYNWLCAICDKFFLSPCELRMHSIQHHYTCNAYRCFDCKERGYHMDNFITHISNHRPVLKLMCYKCPEKFKTIQELKAHKATHFHNKHICHGCNLTFPNKDELDDHKRRFYKNAESKELVVTENNSLTCVICGKTSKSKLTLIQHLLLHTDRKRTHACDTCGKSFYNKKELLQHQVVHVDERPYKCEICHFSFKVRRELKKHAINIHFGTKQFACEECGKCFRHHHALSIHKVVHTDLRPHKCNLCDKSYRFAQQLRNHIRIHTGVKPYSCPYCPQKFRVWAYFNKHSKDVHGVDNVKRKRTFDGFLLYALDPETKEVIYPDEEKINEWKKEIFSNKRVRRRKTDVESSNIIKSVKTQDSEQSDSKI
ncbi:hypothetical protein PYW08_011423 [Mythimna loreyi]|uniref:Uncharacterized protein n=1 Tax=Mythimna loreyi TaxID=667449 RepID=A0ACC2Q5P8_9NEOP|nr:hypothetical protein PYW08_011423 [Mythimna loreyi]